MRTLDGYTCNLCDMPITACDAHAPGTCCGPPLESLSAQSQLIAQRQMFDTALRAIPFLREAWGNNDGAEGESVRLLCTAFERALQLCMDTPALRMPTTEPAVALEEHRQYNQKLTCFMYLLLRDELPAGAVARIVQEVNEGDGTYVFSNKHLEGYAGDVLELLGRNG